MRAVTNRTAKKCKGKKSLKNYYTYSFVRLTLTCLNPTTFFFRCFRSIFVSLLPVVRWCNFNFFEKEEKITATMNVNIILYIDYITFAVIYFAYVVEIVEQSVGGFFSCRFAFCAFFLPLALCFSFIYCMRYVFRLIIYVLFTRNFDCFAHNNDVLTNKEIRWHACSIHPTLFFETRHTWSKVEAFLFNFLTFFCCFDVNVDSIMHIFRMYITLMLVIFMRHIYFKKHSRKVTLPISLHCFVSLYSSIFQMRKSFEQLIDRNSKKSQ